MTQATSRRFAPIDPFCCTADFQKRAFTRIVARLVAVRARRFLKPGESQWHTACCNNKEYDDDVARQGKWTTEQVQQELWGSVLKRYLYCVRCRMQAGQILIKPNRGRLLCHLRQHVGAMNPETEI